MSNESPARDDLWGSDSRAVWRQALDSYDAVVERQGVEALQELDGWVRRDLPELVAARTPRHVTSEELVRVTRWKMARGVWRARNLALVQGNDAREVRDTSIAALAAAPDPRAPIAILARLKGVGPATASAVAAAAEPAVYPFFDELVAGQVPELGKVTFTLGFYLRYAHALRVRAERLRGDWTPVAVERALWAHAGGKAGRG